MNKEERDERMKIMKDGCEGQEAGVQREDT